METLFSLGYFTGARLGDCVNMRWANIDMAARKIRYTPHKTKKTSSEIVVGIAPALYSLLEATPERNRKGLVLPELAGIYARDPSALTKRVQRVFRDAGIETGAEVEGYSRQVAQIGFHSLRHAHITALLESGAPMESVRARVGHSTIGMTAQYYHDTGEATEKALQALPAFGRTNTLPEAPDATGGLYGVILDGLEKLTVLQLKSVVDRAGGLIERLEKTEVQK